MLSITPRHKISDTLARRATPATGVKAKVNATGPSSLVMPLKKGGFGQLINAQALATIKTQVILAITHHPSPAGVQALEALLAGARRVLLEAGITEQILKALFDAGYASDANFTLDIPEMLYIAVTREARQAGRSADGRAPETMLPSWQEMAARLDTPKGRELYKKRAATIEPVFAQLTARLGRTLHYRGDLAGAELALWAASHNILKTIKARSKRLARQALTPPRQRPPRPPPDPHGTANRIHTPQPGRQEQTHRQPGHHHARKTGPDTENEQEPGSSPCRKPARRYSAPGNAAPAPAHR